MNENEKNIIDGKDNDSLGLADPSEQEQAKLDATYPDTEADSAPQAPTAELEKVCDAAEDSSADTQATDGESAGAIEPVAEGDCLPERTDSTESTPAPTETVYHWNYGEQKRIDEEIARKGRSRGALVYGIIMTVAFVAALALLVLLLVGNRLNIFPNASLPSGDGTGELQATVETVISERVVYVRENNNESGLLTTQEIYAKCLPSVVSISVSGSQGSGVGSGFIISSDGYIVTANHVVEDMTSIYVVLSNNQSFPAEVVDGNEFTDIALLKISATGLTPIKIGKSSNLLIGDSVVAIGTPASIDFAGSLAEGKVSYANRHFKLYDDNGNVTKKMELIQTNALVNPGNSGCPLINEYGEAVGIVTMKLNSTYYEGMCFAIPLDAAMPIVNAMKNGQDYSSLLSAVSYSPAKLGISGSNVKWSTSGGDAYGIKVTSFTSSSYDVATKIKIDDIITKINGISVYTVNDIVRILDLYKPGDTVAVTFLRSNQQMTVSVTLGE